MLNSCISQVKGFFKAAGKNMELAILDQEIKVENGVVTIEVVGSVQEEIANKMRPDLVSQIRSLSGADQLSIQILLKEEVETNSNRLYTNSEKLTYLKEKHPALMELQRKFGLEVDF
ncbi:hypothetical protein DFQ04_2407 [Algoriphagus boseongensis]|uniref:DNA polymerase-3 subunit gamma/tau n=2 Tax=Algoriphagus boseongensis TaxID=1442587 RepID=A0A4R6T6J5_9BACT|nr:hypothetical protein DFQ04_2407 [Algoriphagus boseongensis]